MIIIKDETGLVYWPQFGLNTIGNLTSGKGYQTKMYGVFQGLIEEGMSKREFPQMRTDLLMRAIGGLFHGLFFLGHEKKPMSRETMEEFITTFIGNYGTT